MKKIPFILSFFLSGVILFAQDKETVIDNILQEIEDNSQVERLAYELLDEIGPRLVGTPQMKQAHDWAVEKFNSWGIEAENKQYGTWRGWERGVTHIDMVHPRVKSLSGMQLAWSAPTPKKGITAEVITLPETIQDSISFAHWLTGVKGKFVLVSMPQMTGRPDYNWEEFATEASFEKMKEARTEQTTKWNANIRNTGYTSRTLDAALEKAGAAGIIQSQWSRGFGANKIFGSRTKSIPTIDILLEDYGTLSRLAQNGAKPQIRLYTESKELGEVPAFNLIGLTILVVNLNRQPRT